MAWKRVVRRAKLDDLHFHDLRHEAISRFFERGLSIPEVALISGHRILGCCSGTRTQDADIAEKLARSTT